MNSDAQRTRLRVIVADMERALVDGGSEPVRAAWQELVATLALGDEPAMRACPRCGKPGRVAASVCGYCWKALAPA